ncbi:hypothetical protein [Antarcticirhabdus aurantiaca]|uniref:Uncharacterized protein n=1 Tax=Antarcticirhabdus aurantiaca TaxID=2606717 RepID=A0ACD4NSC2_9HYPH|nr:hypothetical protein [Antarcticirhabdus aurantiaca]WAJ29672.1 hypothetical protein OXU80_05435 [Jeongeuplla avenae]
MAPARTITNGLNEAACPIDLALFALLLRSDDRTKIALIREIEPVLRARLALFCYNRGHLRQLAFQVASLCEMRDLRIVGGTMGDVIAEQSREAAPFASEEGPTTRRKGVTLARTAMG